MLQIGASATAVTNSVHLKPTLLHLNLFVHDILQPHLTSSWHDLAASSTVIHTGEPVSSFTDQPKLLMSKVGIHLSRAQR